MNVNDDHNVDDNDADDADDGDDDDYNVMVVMMLMMVLRMMIIIMVVTMLMMTIRVGWDWAEAICGNKVGVSPGMADPIGSGRAFSLGGCINQRLGTIGSRWYLSFRSKF